MYILTILRLSLHRIHLLLHPAPVSLLPRTRSTLTRPRHLIQPHRSSLHLSQVRREKYSLRQLLVSQHTLLMSYRSTENSGPVPFWPYAGPPMPLPHPIDYIPTRPVSFEVPQPTSRRLSFELPRPLLHPLLRTLTWSPRTNPDVLRRQILPGNRDAVFFSPSTGSELQINEICLKIYGHETIVRARHTNDTVLVRSVIKHVVRVLARLWQESTIEEDLATARLGLASFRVEEEHGKVCLTFQPGFPPV
jgi:hypothetical protein